VMPCGNQTFDLRLVRRDISTKIKVLPSQD
jgi:hypothetical protein